MDIISIDNGKCSVIKTSKQFVLIIDDTILGPYPNTKKSVKRVYSLLKGVKENITTYNKGFFICQT